MDAIDVSYTVSGEGPPLYMVHGIGSRRVTWDGLLPGLEEHFTCVRYDLRGHGESPVPPVPYSLDDLVEDLEVLRLRLGHDRIHIIGHFHCDGPFVVAGGRRRRERKDSVDDVLVGLVDVVDERVHREVDPAARLRPRCPASMELGT